MDVWGAREMILSVFMLVGALARDPNPNWISTYPLVVASMEAVGVWHLWKVANLVHAHVNCSRGCSLCEGQFGVGI